MTRAARAWIIWLIAAAYFFYDYTHQVAPSVMTPAFKASFHSNDVVIALLVSILLRETHAEVVHESKTEAASRKNHT